MLYQDTHWVDGGVYTSAEMQSAHSAALVNWAINKNSKLLDSASIGGS